MVACGRTFFEITPDSVNPTATGSMFSMLEEDTCETALVA
jgi:hypothetical protein